MEYTLLKTVGVLVGLALAFVVKKKYPDFPNGKGQVAILVVALALAGIALFNLFIS